MPAYGVAANESLSFLGTKPIDQLARETGFGRGVTFRINLNSGVIVDQNRIALHKNLDPNCPILRFDPDQIRQVLLNLCQNAIDSMPQGGELTIRTQALDDHVEVVVADTGQGMSESTQESIFQPFFTTKAGGTGLGLSVCQKIIHDHGGDIIVRSKAGTGSTFTVCLPIPPTPAH